MSTAYPLPDAKKVQQMLGILFDGLNVTAGGNLGAVDKSWFGVFISDTGEPVALCGADVTLAAAFGTALSMLPPAAMKEAIQKNDISGVMQENLREIMNICTRLVLDSGSPHLKLESVCSGKALPPQAASLIKGAKGQCHFQLQMPKYGGGVLSLLST